MINQKNCAFTGHRRELEELNYDLLDRVIINLINGGVKNFYCGMAIGFDMIAAERVIKLKERFEVALYACIPYEGQAQNYGRENRKRYADIIERCDGEIILSTEYYSGCMQARDRFLVDNCDVIIAYLRKSSGGTHYTVNYANSLDKKVIVI